MSKKTTIECDICGSRISENTLQKESAKIQLWPPCDYRAGPGQRIDMCLKCFKKFVVFLEENK